MKIIHIINQLEQRFPLSFAEKWDNCGFLLGNREKDAKKILFTLDITQDTVTQAIKCHADLILSHHPILFSGIRKITTDTPEGILITDLIQHDIAVYSAHTNLDYAPNTINDALTRMFDLTEPQIIEPNVQIPEIGLGRIGTLPKPIRLFEFVEAVKNKLNTPCVRVCGDLNQIVSKIAVASGSCSEIIPKALQLGGDVILTADLKYHESLESVQKGISIIDAGHFATEQFVVHILKHALKSYESHLEFIIAEQQDVFQFV